MALINQNSLIGITSITSPGASNVLTVHTNDTTERLRVTANGLSFSGTNASLDTSGNLTVGGNVSVGGTLTYEDVTNIDAVGIITARSGINVTGGSVGIGTDTTDRQLAIYHNTQATLELKSSNTGQSSLWFSDIDDGNIGGVYYEHTNNVLVLRTNDADRLRITSDGTILAGGQTSSIDGAFTNLELRKDSSGEGGSLTLVNDESADATSTCSISVFQNYRNAGEIIFGRENANNWQSSAGGAASYIAFKTNSSGTHAERLRITSTGKLQAYRGTSTTGKTSGSEAFTVGNGGGNHRFAVYPDGTTVIGGTGDIGNNNIQLQNDGMIFAGAAHFTKNLTPTSGRGVEIYEPSAGVGQIQSYNRDSTSWDELKLKGSEVRIHTGSSNALTLDLQKSASTLYGTSDGIFNLDTTDGRGAFIRFKENGTTKAWVGSAEGMGGGFVSPDQDDLGLRAVGNMLFSTDGGERLRIDETGRVHIGNNTGTGYYAQPVFQVHGYQNTPAGAGWMSINSGSSTPGVNENIALLSFVNGGNGESARIECEAEAAHSGTSSSGRLIFLTTATGSARTASERMRIASGGKITAPGVYNGTTTGGGPVYVEADGDLLRYTSSLKYKTDVETIEDARADAILNVRPVWYRSKCENDVKTEGAEKSDWGWYGFIAEELAEIEPRLVNWATKDAVLNEKGSMRSVERDPADYTAEGVRYDNFVPLLVNLVQRQKTQIEALEKRLTDAGL